MSTALPKRAALPKAHTWDVEAIFKDDKSWDAAFAVASGAIDALAAYRGRLGESGAVLLAFLQLHDAQAPEIRRIYAYASLNADADTANQRYASMQGRASALYARFGEAISFVSPELLALSSVRISELMDEAPALRGYVHYFDNIQRMRPHVRSAEVEAVLAQSREALNAPERAHGMLADAELKFTPAKTEKGKSVAIGRGNIHACLTSADRTLRKSAWTSYNDAFLGMRNTLTEIMAAKVKATVFNARVRHYPDSLAYGLTPNAVPVPVYHNVIEACNRHRGIWHRFWDAKRKLLGLRKMESCDIFAPLGKPIKVSWEQACDWLVEGMAPLGKAYTDAVKRGVTKDRWVDWRPNQGKRGGAYSAGGYGMRPYILMSFHDNGFTGLSTLAHEVGHSMHTLLSCQNQPYVYSDYTLFVAEVASNFNQALVRAHLLNLPQAKKNRQFMTGVIEEAMYNFHRYFFVMPILSQWELWVHQQVEQGGSLTADALNGKLAELFEAGYGPAWKLDAPREGIQWSQFPHFYADFYVYQYASGIAAANALAAGVLADASGGAAERYLNFLKSGSSLYPLDALKLAGIDMSTQAPVDQAFAVLEGFVARLEALAD
jgi:oligoendopeptidase F